MNNKILKYSEESMMQALQAVKNGMTVSAGSRKFEVPRITLYYKHIRKYPEKRKMGPSTYLTSREENGLVQWLLHMEKNGFPINKQYLLDSVQLIVKKLKKNTPFVDGRPGRHWYDLFLKRHLEISERMSQNLTSSRSYVSEEKIRQWFDEVKRYLEENDYLDITNDPSRVFNTDETAFFLSPKGGKVLAKKGEKTIYNRISANEKGCLTTLITGNAAGALAPPMIVFSYERIPASIAASIPKSWAIGKSESGWMTGETFFMYISNTFSSWLRENGIKLPVILFVDGHSSHLTLPLSEYCNSNGIILVALYPNATHILQPMDVAIFHPLKVSWKEVILKWRITHNAENLRKEHFAPLLKEALDKTITQEMLANGFRTCGLCPLNSNAINYKKFINSIEGDNGKEEAKEDHQEQRKQSFVGELQEKIGNEKLLLFQSVEGEWNGPIEDTALFELWKAVNKRTGNKNSISIEQVPDIQIEIVDVPEDITNLLSAPNVSEVAFHNTDYIFDADWINEVLNEDNKEETKLPSASLLDENNNKNDLKVHIISDITLNHATVDQTSNKTNEDLHENFPKDTSTVQGSEEIYEVAIEHMNEQETLKESEKENAGVVNNAPDGIPTPFKTLLQWPETPKIGNKRKVKVKLPFVASSEQWQQYHKQVAEKKQALEIAKLERKRKREENLQKKNLKKKTNKEPKPKKTSVVSAEAKKSPALNNEIHENVNVENKFEKDGHVIVTYEDVYYPGQVLEVQPEKLFVTVMEKSGLNCWKWPTQPDCLGYAHSDVIKIISPPTKINNRGVFSVNEMEQYLDFMK